MRAVCGRVRLRVRLRLLRRVRQPDRRAGRGHVEDAVESDDACGKLPSRTRTRTTDYDYNYDYGCYDEFDSWNDVPVADAPAMWSWRMSRRKLYESYDYDYDCYDDYGSRMDEPAADTSDDVVEVDDDGEAGESCESAEYDEYEYDYGYKSYSYESYQDSMADAAAAPSATMWSPVANPLLPSLNRRMSGRCRSCTSTTTTNRTMPARRTT